MSLLQPSPRRARPLPQANQPAGRNTLATSRTTQQRPTTTGPSSQSRATINPPRIPANSILSPANTTPHSLSQTIPVTSPTRPRPTVRRTLDHPPPTNSTSSHAARCIACAARLSNNSVRRAPPPAQRPPPAAQASHTTAATRRESNRVRRSPMVVPTNNSPARVTTAPVVQERSGPEPPAVAPPPPPQRRPTTPSAQTPIPPPRTRSQPTTPLARQEQLLSRIPLVLYIPAPTDESLSPVKGKASTSVKCWADNWVESDYPYVALEDNRAVCPICTLDFEEPRRRVSLKSTASRPVSMKREIPWEPLRQLPCKHVFHKSCLDPWILKGSTSCPYCRKSIKEVAPDPI